MIFRIAWGVVGVLLVLLLVFARNPGPAPASKALAGVGWLAWFVLAFLTAVVHCGYILWLMWR